MTFRLPEGWMATRRYDLPSFTFHFRYAPEWSNHSVEFMAYHGVEATLEDLWLEQANKRTEALAKWDLEEDQRNQIWYANLKAAKESVDYGPAKMSSPERCGNCRYFVASMGRCKKVMGRIKRDHWCKLWKRREE